MKKHNKTLLKEEKACGIFNPDFLHMIKKRQFSGRLRVIWHGGKLELFDLSSKLKFRIRKGGRPDDIEFFDDGFW